MNNQENFRQANIDRHQALEKLEERKAKMIIINNFRQTIIESGNESGNFVCPFCEGRIDYQYIKDTDELKLKCDNNGCLDIDEINTL
jgi:hypothetical protein